MCSSFRALGHFLTPLCVIQLQKIQDTEDCGVVQREAIRVFYKGNRSCITRETTGYTRETAGVLQTSGCITEETSWYTAKGNHKWVTK